MRAILPTNQLSGHPGAIQYDEVWIPNVEIEYLLEVEDANLERGVAEAFTAFLVPRGRKHLFRNTGSRLAVIYEIQIGTITDTDKEVFTGAL